MGPALESALRGAIRDRRLRDGQRLPSTRALARDLGLARGTVVEAYAQLAAEGWLVARQGAGTEVAAGASLPAAGPAAAAESRPAPAADLRLGRPDPSSFPRAAWVAALRRALRDAPDAALGPADPRGALILREALAASLARVRGVAAAPEAIVVTSGFAQGLRLVAEALAATGHTAIALEDPCLPDHRTIVRAGGLDVEALPVDEEGARVAGVSAPALLLTPAHQCPLGATLSPGRRSAALAAGRLLVEDDYDAEFRYDRRPVGALQGRAPDRVVYAGSASKTLAPGLRLGWLVVPETLLEAVVEAKRRADRGTPVLDQLALAELICSGGLDRHVRRMRLRYRRRRDDIAATVRSARPDAHLLGTAAGLHLVAAMPGEAALAAAAAAAGVALTGLEPFWHGGPRPVEGLVLGYGAPAQHAFPEALRRLRAALCHHA